MQILQMVLFRKITEKFGFLPGTYYLADKNMWSFIAPTRGYTCLSLYISC